MVRTKMLSTELLTDNNLGSDLTGRKFAANLSRTFEKKWISGCWEAGKETRGLCGDQSARAFRGICLCRQR